MSASEKALSCAAVRLAGPFSLTPALRYFLCGMPGQQKRVDVVSRVLHAVLIQRQSAPSETHGGKTIPV